MFLKLLTSALLFSTVSNALAPVGLGTAAAYLVLGGQAVTNTGPALPYQFRNRLWQDLL